MNFKIENKGIVSDKFLKSGINNFEKACEFIASLPYKRNKDKNDILCVFEDKAGTCSTKHSTLRKLAIENEKEEVKLILGIFKMDAEYNSKIKNTLDENELKYIPEAHNYLKIGNAYLDFTKPNAAYSDFQNKLLEETEIEYNQINNDKIEIHKNFLAKWIENKPALSLDKIWKIREQCIQDLAGN